MRHPGKRYFVCRRTDRRPDWRRRPLANAGASIALVALAITLAGCGGASHKASTQASTTTDAATSTATTSTSASSSKKHVPKRHVAPTHKGFRHGPPSLALKHGRHAPPPLGPKLTFAQLKQKANAACATANAKQAAIPRPSDFDTNARSAAGYLSKLEPIQAAELRALHLNPPSSVQGRYITFFAGVVHQQLLVVLAANQARAGQGDYLKQYQSASSYRQQFVTPAAKRLGLSSCA